MADKTVICKDCKKQFVITDREQALIKEKCCGNNPRRCPECREAREKNRVMYINKRQNELQSV